VRSLSSELAPHVPEGVPRVYADANLPAGVIAFMRQRLGWDVLFVLEHDDLRRARDVAHFRLARQLHRTLVTLDRDYLDDRRFPPDATAGVLVLSAPDERGLANLLTRLARSLYPSDGARPGSSGLLPLEGRKLHASSDWQPDRT
jgi:hypothetical protein